jgi:hypothetical protein
MADGIHAVVHAEHPPRLDARLDRPPIEPERPKLPRGDAAMLTARDHPDLPINLVYD